MADIQKLAHAPVIEAIFVFHVDVSAKWVPEAVVTAAVAMFPDFTEKQEQRVFEQTVEIDATGNTTESNQNTVSAYILRLPDHSSAVQVRKDGFAFSKLEPYENWESFCASALDGWRKYAAHFEVEMISLAFIRFINKLKPGGTTLDLESYFDPAPDTPRGVDWKFAGFAEHHRYGTQDGEYWIESNLTMIEGTPSLEFLLDNTVRPCKSPLTTDELIDALPRIHELKNQAFFSKLKPAALTPYLPSV